MSWLEPPTFAPMRGVIWIVAFLLAGSGLVQAQSGASPLARAVRPTLVDAPLTGMLATLARQSGVPFSYSSTRIGGRRHCHVPPGPPRPLGAVLHEVAGQFRLSYGLLNGQLVLWPASEPAPPGVAELNGLGGPVGRLPATAPGSGRRAKLEALPAPEAKAGAIALASISGHTASLADRAGEHSRALGWGSKTPVRRSQPAGRLGKANVGGLAAWNTAPSAAATAGHRAPSPAVPAIAGASNAGRRSGKENFGPASGLSSSSAPLLLHSKSEFKHRVLRSLADELPLLPCPVRLAQQAPTAAELPALLAAGPAPVPVPRPQLLVRRQPAQVSLVPPLSSNGLANARTVNAYSLNVLAGYSAGVSRLELGGLLNVVRDSVHGLQAAGLANVSGTDVRGIQLAGFVNVNGGAVRGVQGAGMFNVARDDVRGLQVAGFANITGGAARAGRLTDQPTRVRRWLGLPRLLATDPLGQLPVAPSASQRGMLVQLAALANLTGTDVRGVQSAALLNLAHHVTGAQIGLVNVARHVGGAQFGLINIADSVDGVSLGIINIVRHGYLHGEVWTSETLPLNAVVKLGVRRYYTLLGASAEPFGNRVQWAAGIGVGTAGLPKGRFTFSLDLLHWTLAGTLNGANNQAIDNRLLTQLRPAVAWQIERGSHLQLVVAPTLNLAIAWSNDHQPQWDFGANQLLLIDTAGDQSRTRLWPGLQVGLRF